MKSLLALLAVLFAAPAFAQPGSQPAPMLQDERALVLLGQMREACGGAAWDRVEGWHETGRVDLPGRSGVPYEAWHDMHRPTAAYVNRVGGRVVRASGFDGEQAWQAGPDGRVQFTTDETALWRIRRDAFLSSFAWFFRDRYFFMVLSGGVREHGGRRYDVLRFAPERSGAFELWVDPETHLVGRIVAGNEVAELSDYRFFSGVCTATTGRQSDGDPAHDLVLHVESVETGPVDPARFAPPPAPAGQ